ncbi:MAG: addiction module protein [bacterium]
MNTKTKKIIDEALKLSEQERIEIAELIMNSLEHTEHESDVDAAWAAEIHRRSKEIETESVRPLAWSEVQELAKDKVENNA